MQQKRGVGGELTSLIIHYLRKWGEEGNRKREKVTKEKLRNVGGDHQRRGGSSCRGCFPLNAWVGGGDSAKVIKGAKFFLGFVGPVTAKHINNRRLPGGKGREFERKGKERKAISELHEKW